MARIKIIGLHNGRWTKFAGQYLVSFDANEAGDTPTERWLRCKLETTPDPERAKAMTESAARALLDTRSRRWPIARDGTIPNRPLSAFIVEID